MLFRFSAMRRISSFGRLSSGMVEMAILSLQRSRRAGFLHSGQICSIMKLGSISTPSSSLGTPHIGGATTWAVQLQSTWSAAPNL